MAGTRNGGKEVFDGIYEMNRIEGAWIWMGVVLPE